ncbi:hypothetical protein CHUAL_000179 [Chamberlinius hualienensis]
MKGYLIIIVLVTLSSQQWNTIALSVSIQPLNIIRLDLNLLSKTPVPYYTYDNECTRITPAASSNQVVGQYDVYYYPLLVCSTYSISRKKNYFEKEFYEWTTSRRVHYRSFENPAKPGETQDYPGDLPPTLISRRNIKPNTVTVIVAYKKDVGYGFLECPARNGSNITAAYVVGFKGVKTSDIDPIRDEVSKLATGIELYPIDRKSCDTGDAVFLGAIFG